MKERRDGLPGEPFTVEEDGAFLVVYKPPRMHSSPLKRNAAAPGGTAGTDPASPDTTLLEWCARVYPEITAVRGRGAGEGGLLHRLDYETAGLALIARTEASFDALLAAGKAGVFVKEYAALAAKTTAASLPSMPPPPFPAERFPVAEGSPPPVFIESAFRAYGPGRKAVRPVPYPPCGKTGKALKEIALDQGRPYRTGVLEVTEIELSLLSARLFRLRIYRGFRHQIRCHLAWQGFPLLNDALYGGASWPARPGIALFAAALSFPDPLTGARREYRMVPDFSGKVE